MPCPAFPCLCDGTGLEVALSAAHGCALVPRDPLHVSGHQDPTALCEAVTRVHLLLFLNVGHWAVMSPAIPAHIHPLQGLGQLQTGHQLSLKTWEWRQTTGSLS